jgi:hypothetical protein
LRTSTSPEAVLLLRFLGNERPNTSLPSWPPVSGFSCYLLPDEYVIRPKDALRPYLGDGSPPAGAIALTERGRAFLRNNESGQVTYVDLGTGDWVASNTGPGDRIFYDGWEMVRRIEGGETVVVSYPHHRLRPLPKVSSTAQPLRWRFADDLMGFGRCYACKISFRAVANSLPTSSYRSES